VIVNAGVVPMLLPPLVLTDTLRSPSAAVASITKTAVRDVPLVTVTVPTVTPDVAKPVRVTVTVVAPAMKLVPVKVTVTVVPAAPLVGLKAVTVGDAGYSVNVTAPLVPPAVDTLTLRSPRAAAASMTKLTVSDVLLATLTLDAVTPVPLTATIVAPLTKFVPVNVLETVVPTTAVLRFKLVSVGAAGLMVNVCAPLVPPAVVTVTVRAPSVAAASMTKLAVSDVALVTLTLPTVTPPPLTVTVVAPATKFAPVSVSLTVAPVTPLAELTPVSVGTVGAGDVESLLPQPARNVVQPARRLASTTRRISMGTPDE
jgi:hypothetical protein